MSPPSAPPDASRQPDLRCDADGTVLAANDRAAAPLASRDRDTEQRLAELEAVYDAAPVGLCVLDTDLRFVRLNRRFAEINGVPVEEHIGRTPAEVVPDLGDQAEAAMRRVLETGEMVELEVSGTTPAQPGIVRHWDERWKPIFDGAGEIIGISISAEEVTERKAAEAALREANARLEERVQERTAEFEDANVRLQAGIAERTQAAAALQESEAKYRTLITTMAQGFCIIEKVQTAADQPSDFRYITANQAFERHTGVHDVIGKTIREIVPDYEESVIDLYDDVVRTGQPRRFEAFIAAQGYWYEAEALPAEKPGRIAILFSNVTDQKMAEAVLVASEARQAFLLTLNDALRPLFDPVEIQETAARALGERLGADRVAYFDVIGDEYVIERDYPRSVPSMADRYPVEAFGLRLLADFRSGTTEVSDDTGADSDLTPEEQANFAAVQIRAYIGVPLVKAGAFVAGLAVHTSAPRAWTVDEIALVEETAERTWAAVERARAEARLRETEAELAVTEAVADERQRLFAVLEALPVAICLLTPDYGIAFANRRFRETIGASVGRPCYETCFGLSEPCPFCESFRVLETGEPHRWEVALPNGRIIEANDLPFTDVDGTPMVLEMDRDVTEERHLEAALREANARLEERVQERTAELEDANARLRTGIAERTRAEQALRELAESLQRSNEDLERFAYVASHDLQEPLRSIVSFSQLLERRYRGQLGDDADEYIDFIVEGGTRMQGLILDLLTFSRVNTARQQITRTDVEDVFAEAVLALDVSLREAGATLTHDPLPAVMADPVQLLQVFSNLISNAVKFRKPDVPLRVHVGVCRADGFCEFSVSDNGIGIGPEYFDRIFVIFQRLHTKETYPGTGIGLAIVKRIIDRHGGTIRVESTPGEGTTFYFTLPAA